MRLSDTLKTICGSIIVYYVMAACSASPGSSSAPSSSVPGGASNGSGGSNGGSGTDPASSGSGSSGGNGGGSNGSGSSSGGKSSSGGPVPDAYADQTQSGSRLKAEYYVGGDGSKQWDYSFQDTARNDEHCSFSTAADGSIRCLPSGIQAGIFYSDANCSVSIAYVVTPCATTPAYATSTATTSACPAKYEYHVYAVASKYTGTVYTGTPGSCSAYAAFPYAAYALGDEIAPGSFQQATVQTD
jgi:hypothetical protein